MKLLMAALLLFFLITGTRTDKIPDIIISYPDITVDEII